MNLKNFYTMIMEWMRMILMCDKDTQSVDVDAYGWDGSGD